jgi:hypothetical protein
MAKRKSIFSSCGPGPQKSAGRQPGGPYLETCAGRLVVRSEASPVSPGLAQSGPGAPMEAKTQPPAAPAATEVASGHPARWAPHPSAETAPGTEPSPRTPALVTMPPRQKLVDEAPSVKATKPAADPSSLPVADSVGRRAAAPGARLASAEETSCTGVTRTNGPGRKNQDVHRGASREDGQPPHHGGARAGP